MTVLLYIILLVLTLTFCIYKYYAKHFRYWSDRGIKGPPPLIGFGNVLTRFIWEKTHVELAWISKYGKLYGIYDGKIPVLSVAEPELIKDILVKDFHIFDDRINNRFSHPLLSNDMNRAVGNDWKRQRSIISPVFTSGKMRRMYPTIRGCVDELLDVLKTHATTGLEVDMKRVFGNYTIDVISECAFATKINAQKNPDNPIVKHAAKPMNPKIYRFLALMVLPKCMLQLFQTTHNAADDQIKFFVDLIQHIINERKKSNEKHNDLIDLLLNAAKNSNKSESITRDEADINESHHIMQGADELAVERQLFSQIPKHMTEDEVLANCFLFYVAGYESTANTLSFAAHELATNADKQQLLYEEIVANIDQSGELSYDQLMTMPFLDAVLSETLRLHAPAVRLWRYANQDYRLGDTGITIKKGDRIEIPNHALHYLDEYFPNPHTFNPDRFLLQNRHKIVPYSYTPFGGGPRHCVGMRFALMEAKLVLTHIIKNYKLITMVNTDIPVSLGRNQILHAPTRVIVGIQKRS